MDVNDNEGTRMYCGVCGFIASILQCMKSKRLRMVIKTTSVQGQNNNNPPTRPAFQAPSRWPAFWNVLRNDSLTKKETFA